MRNDGEMRKRYSLYLDDMRGLPQQHLDWVLCRSISEMLELVRENGPPEVASFDYDLDHTEPGASGNHALNRFLDELIAQKDQSPGISVEVHLHTNSKHGRQRMAETMKDRKEELEGHGLQVRFEDVN